MGKLNQVGLFDIIVLPDRHSVSDCLEINFCGDFVLFCTFWYKDEKEEIWPSPMTKALIPTEMSKGQSDNTNNATKKFD